MTRFVILGGASGAGKTTLLNRLGPLETINTGTCFKERLALRNRDEVRSSDWTAVEDGVAKDLADWAMATLVCGLPGPAIIDTHFGAKTTTGGYRIGLRWDLLNALGLEVFRYAQKLAIRCSVRVILITTDAHSLLERRRLDASRRRELVPSDCVNALRANEGYVPDYFRAFLRSERLVYPEVGSHVAMARCLNDDLHEATKHLEMLIYSD